MIENLDKSMIGVGLLEECNFSCIHCSREDNMYPGYKLSLEQMETCLSDCSNLQSIQRVYFTGGEPTLWTDENLDFVDLLVEVAEIGFTPGFTTNGSNFSDYSKCHSFLERYFHTSSKPLHVFISVDTFHRNFDEESGRARSLDNVIRYKDDTPGTELSISVAATISRDYSSLLPDDMIEHYESLGVGFGFRPLMLMGKAKSLSHLCPNTGSDKPDDLGAYYRFRPQPRREPPRRLVLFGNDYYLSHPLEKAAQLGNLPESAIAAYFKTGGAA